MTKTLTILALALLVVACGKKEEKATDKKAEGQKESAATGTKWDKTKLEALSKSTTLEGYTKDQGMVTDEMALVPFSNGPKNAKGAGMKINIQYSPCIFCDNITEKGLKDSYLLMSKEDIREIKEIDYEGKKMVYVYGKNYSESQTKNGVSRVHTHALHLLCHNGTNVISVQVNADLWPKSAADLDQITKEELLAAAQKAMKVALPNL